MEESTFCAREPHVKDFRLPATEEEWLTNVLSYSGTSSDFCDEQCRDGSSGRTFPGFSAMAIPWSKPCKRFARAGIASLGGYSILSSPEHPATLAPSRSPEDVSMLSEILEPIGDIPQRYYMTPKAAAGLLRRAVARKKTLPLLLQAVLQAMVEAADSEPMPKSPT